MPSEPYIRPTLWATFRDRLDPATELDVWQDELRELLDDRRPEPPEVYAFLLVTLTCRLRRVRPEMMDAALQQRAESRLAEEAPRWARLALEVPNPAAWLNEAEQLSHSYDQEVDPAEQVELACELIQDLDDVDLACWYARTLDIEDRELQEQLARCHRYLAAHADEFFAASILVQTIGHLLRPDLAEFADGLAPTAEKYRLLLDAFVVAEQELDFQQQPVLSLEERRALMKASERGRGDQVVLAAPRATPSWLPVDRSGEIAAAALDAGQAEEICWLSPDGRFEAVFSPDPEGSGGAQELAWLSFHRRDANMSPATELVGEPVVLAGVAGVVDAQAKTSFPLGRLREAGSSEPTLTVGRDGPAWSRQPCDV